VNCSLTSQKYLLDVNVLIAYGFRRHGFHDRVGAWIRSRKGDRFLTCSITELICPCAWECSNLWDDVAHAKSLLQELKAWKGLPLEFINDGNDISALPKWAKSPKQTTDGHLVQLAVANAAVLVTLDEGIPGTF